VADDDARVRAAIGALLAPEAGFAVVAEAADGEAALHLASSLGADMVLVDVRMPGGGPELVRALTGLRPPPVVVGLSADAVASTWISLLTAGASSYLLKGSVAGDLPLLLRRCAAGELVVAVPGAARTVRRHLAPPR
jgi:DNA-binding NarL/FixJ family response regulator